MSKHSELKELMLQAPEGQIDPSILPTIEKWSDPIKAVEILETLDRAVFCGGASDFAMQVFNILLDEAIAEEGTEYADVVARAVWRTGITE